MTGRDDLAEARWRKCSHSADTGSCVEVAHTETTFGIRDSKNVGGPMVVLTARQGLAFLDAVRGL